MCYKKTCFFLLLLLSGIHTAPTAEASHAGGAELIYQHISGSRYRFYYKFYRDCGGIPEPGVIDLCYRSSCDTANYYAELVKAGMLPDGRPNGAPVNPGCPDYPTTCNNGSLKGYREWWYYTDITLPKQCDSWTFSTSIYARNPSNNITSAPYQSFNLYVETTLDNLHAPDNSSPYFTVNPVPYVCAGVPYAYNNGAVDPDGDSLSFDVIQPLSSAEFCPEWPTRHQLPFTSQIYNLTDNPISTANTFSIDAYTGQMYYTPNIQQRGTITVRVREYRQGRLIGTVMRDIQVTVIACNNPPPDFALDTPGITGGRYLDNAVQTCAGDSLAFCFTVKGKEASSVLVVRDNGRQTLPGADIAYTGMLTNAVRGCVRWTPAVRDTGLHVLSVIVVDSQCKPPGMLVPYSYSVPVRVGFVRTTAITGAPAICAGDSARLSAAGGTTFTWSVVSGDPASLGCTVCPRPWASPRQTTTYAVTSDLSGFCARPADTFTLTVQPVPDIDPGPDIIKCETDTVLLNAAMAGLPPPDYDITWQPQTYIDSPQVLTPRSWTPVTTTYKLVAQYRTGLRCSASDTLQVLVQGTDLQLSDTTVCAGGAFTLDAGYTSGFSYLWDFGDGTTDTGAVARHQYMLPGSYRVTLMAQSSRPCYDTATAVITVDTFAYPGFTMDRDSICAGAAINFYPEYHSGAGMLAWDFGDGTVSAAWQPEHNYDGSGTMVVTLTAKHPHCPDTSYRDTVFVFPYPVVNLGPDTTLCPGMPPLLLENIAADMTGSVYLWSTGSRSRSIMADHPDSYFLTLTSAFGCATTDSIEIRRSCFIGIPNAFTPDGDGWNDYFFPRDLLAGGLTYFRMQVFNRWGQVVFETDRIDGKGWDGRFHNVEQPQGVYAYLIAVRFRNGVAEKYQGNVTLLR